MDAEQAWQSALGQLQMEMPKASFDTWVRDTQVTSYEDGLSLLLYTMHMPVIGWKPPFQHGNPPPDRNHESLCAGNVCRAFQ